MGRRSGSATNERASASDKLSWALHPRKPELRAGNHLPTDPFDRGTSDRGDRPGLGSHSDRKSK